MGAARTAPQRQQGGPRLRLRFFEPESDSDNRAQHTLHLCIAWPACHGSTGSPTLHPRPPPSVLPPTSTRPACSSRTEGGGPPSAPSAWIGGKRGQQCVASAEVTTEVRRVRCIPVYMYQPTTGLQFGGTAAFQPYTPEASASGSHRTPTLARGGPTVPWQRPKTLPCKGAWRLAGTEREGRQAGAGQQAGVLTLSMTLAVSPG